MGTSATSATAAPISLIEPTQQFTDSVSWIKGKHTFKFGASIIHRDVNWDQGNNAKGYFWIDDGNYGAVSRPNFGPWDLHRL